MNRQGWDTRYIPVIIGILFSIVGLALLKLGQAATAAAAAEPENGVIAGNAAAKTVDSTTSGGRTVVFGGGSSSGTLYQAVCSKQINITTSGRLSNSNFDELSGIAASRTTDNAYWVENDSGDSARIFAVNGSGALLGTFTISGASATDWEDIDTGPGPVSGQSYIYVADTGNNDLDRNPVQIYRIPEPNPNNNGATKSVSGAAKLNLIYPGGTRHNVEAVFVDPSTGEIYLVDKSDSRAAEIFKAPANLAANSTTTVTKVGTVGYAAGGDYELITGADMSAAGNAIAIRTYEHLYVYNKPAGSTVAAALAGTACTMPSFSEDKGEAVGFKRSSNGLVTVSEGSNQPLHNFDPL